MQMIMRAATMEWRFLERNVVHFSDDDDAVNSERRTKKSSSYKFCRIATVWVYTVYTELFWIQFDGIFVPVHLFL